MPSINPVVRLGSIPAWAGEPEVRRWYNRLAGVYPRVGGGTAYGLPTLDLEVGLSPRVRGNPWLPVLAIGNVGSIPARAGESARGEV